MPPEKRYKLDNGKDVVCIEVVRSLPGKRLVFLGEYEGEKVFAKLYLDPKRGERHWRRELDGLHAFNGHAITTAEILYSGKTAEQGLPIVVLEQLQGVVSVKQAWSESDDTIREQILKRMVLLLARHHKAGLCQTDLHLDNFLLSDREIFSLDGAGVQVHADGVSQDAMLENLGLFVAQLTPQWESMVQDICDIYSAEIGWREGPGSDILLEKVQKAREQRWKEFRGKLFRNCTAFTYTEYPDGFQVVSNRHANSELFKLLLQPDTSFPGKDQAMKNGNTCTVWSAAADGLNLVVKRYNVKGFWHGLKLRSLPGRGERSWVNGHRLLFYGIPTPNPVALLKQRRGGFPITYLLTEQVEAVSARDWLRDPAVSNEDKENMAVQIAEMLNDLQRQEISHGDLKATNILIADGKAMLIDLDAMRRHKCDFTFKKAWARDIQRFLENWKEDQYLFDLFVKALQAHGIGTKVTI